MSLDVSTACITTLNALLFSACITTLVALLSKACITTLDALLSRARATTLHLHLTSTQQLNREDSMQGDLANLVYLCVMWKKIFSENILCDSFL